MVVRSWQCQNKRCAKQFDSWDDYPECPHCCCARTSWVPGGGHVSHIAALDKSLKSLAKSYKMTDINSASPSRLNRSMPKVEPRVADGPVLRYAPGFSAPFNTQGLSTCEPSRDRVDFKVTAAAEKALVPQAGRNYPQIGASHWKTMRRAFKP